MMKLFGRGEKSKKGNVKDEKSSVHDVRYTAVMRALVWRYVSAMHRKLDDEPVTEDDINELKGDVSALRYELLDVLGRNGMDVSFTDRKEKTVLAKRVKIWERRLMKDFQVAPVSVMNEDGRPVHEDALSRFRRIAKMAAAASSNDKWKLTLAATGMSCQIGRCRSRESFKSQQKLQQAMEQAKRLVMRSPLPEISRSVTPVDMPKSPGHNLLALIRDISSDVGAHVDLRTPTHLRPDDTRVLLSPSSYLDDTTKLHRPIPKPRSRSASPNRPRRNLSPMPNRVIDATDVPKVATKKPPLSSGKSQDSDKSSDEIVVARPVAPDMKPVGYLPPPPYTKSKMQPPPTMEVTPCTPICTRGRSPKRGHLKVSPQPRTPSPKHIPQTGSPVDSTTAASTEHLVPPPVTLRSLKLEDDIRSIKRPSRTGWL
ncbi:transient-receptor-potential-like protein [Leptidea sinapis]|uniref:transient-receptor-potential-like protein n=1 Tax=Leptidea sinapis TaxID=189913 RepID=UPI0021C3042B|nr:transient-receptor-potential-like protein [Leptidea sinapis]